MIDNFRLKTCLPLEGKVAVGRMRCKKVFAFSERMEYHIEWFCLGGFGGNRANNNISERVGKENNE